MGGTLKLWKPLNAGTLHSPKCDRHAKALLMSRAWMVTAAQSGGPIAWISQEPDGLHAAPSLQTSLLWHVMWSWWHWQRCHWGKTQRQQAPPWKLCTFQTPWCCPTILPQSPPLALPSYRQRLLDTRAQTVGGKAQLPLWTSRINWPEWQGHANSMICIIPVNKNVPMNYGLCI